MPKHSAHTATPSDVHFPDRPTPEELASAPGAGSGSVLVCYVDADLSGGSSGV